MRSKIFVMKCLLVGLCLLLTGCAATGGQQVAEKEESRLAEEAAADLRASRKVQIAQLEEFLVPVTQRLGEGKVLRSIDPGLPLRCSLRVGWLKREPGALTFAEIEDHYGSDVDLEGALLQLAAEFAKRDGWVVNLTNPDAQVYLSLNSAGGEKYVLRVTSRAKEAGSQILKISSFGGCVRVPEQFDMFEKY